MGECPFCEAEVDEDLVIYGGTCPSCLGDIPGEEAATDPGEEVKKAQEAADRRRVFIRGLIPVLLSLPFVAMLGAYAVYLAFFKEPPQAVALDFDTFEDYYVPEFTGVEQEEVGEAGNPDGTLAPQPKVAARPDPKGNPFANASGADQVMNTTDGDAVAQLDEGEDKYDDGVRGTRGASDGAATPDGLTPDNLGGGSMGGDNPLSLGGVASGVQRKKPLLTDPVDIKGHIGGRMKQYFPQLNSCYERALKSKPELQGRWKIEYVIDRDGTVNAAKAVPQGTSDADLEKCLARKVKRWDFYRLVADQPVSKTIRFRPAL